MFPIALRIFVLKQCQTTSILFVVSILVWYTYGLSRDDDGGNSILPMFLALWPHMAAIIVLCKVEL